MGPLSLQRLRLLLTAHSPNGKIFRATLAIGFFGAIAKLAVAGKELLTARAFGRGDTMDAFLIAYLVPSVVVAMLMGALAVCFLPVFVSVRQQEGHEAAQRLFSRVLFLCVVSLTVVAILLGIGAKWFLPYLGSAFFPAKLHFTRQLLYALLPFVVFNGISQFAAAALNAGEKFSAPAVIPVITPVLTVVLIIFAKNWGVYALVAGAVGGSILEAVWLLRMLHTHGFRLTLDMGLDPDVRKVLSQFFPVLGGTFLMGGTAIVDQSMAARLPSGSVAALSYGGKVVGLILSIGATALSTAVLPYFSQMAAAHDWNGCRHTLKKYSLLVAVTTIPFTLGLILFSRPLVALLFQRGAFTPADTLLVSRVQSCYAIQIPFYICGMLFVRFLSAMRRNELLMYGSSLNLAIDIVLNLIFIKYLGLAGIALSTAAVMFSSCIFVALCSIRLLRQSSVGLPEEARSETAAV